MNPTRTRTPASISIGRIAKTAIATALLSGCALVSSPVPSGKPVRDVYEDSSTSNGTGSKLTIDREPGHDAREKTKPVIYPPKVFAVWVVEHLDLERDIKIGSHWVFFKLRDSSWIEEPIDREPEPTADAVEASDLARLKRAVGQGKLATILLPYRTNGSSSTVPTTSEDRNTEPDPDADAEFDSEATGKRERP